MKWIAVLLSFLVSLSAFALTDLDQPIRIAQSNMNGDEFLKELAKQTNIKFVLKGPKIQFSKPVTMFLKDAPLKEVMDDFAKQQKISWSASDNNTIHIFRH